MTPPYTRVTGPTFEPVSLTEAKAQARIGDDYSNFILERFIAAGREAAEEYLGYGLITQTWQLALAAWADVIALPMARVLQNDAAASPSTAIRVEYYDADGARQTLAPAAYLVDPTARPATLTRAPGASWPGLQGDRRAAAVVITYVVGWPTAEAVPERIKQGIRSYITYLDLDRDGLEPNALGARRAAEACWTDRIYWTAPGGE